MIFVFIFLASNSYAMPSSNSSPAPSISDVIFSPFKIIAKPYIWWRYGYENKVDEYKVEITYNLEFDGEPIVIKKAIACEIYEGVFRSDRDGVRKPTRRVEESVNQILYKVEKTGEILILTVPGHCVVDKAYKVEKDNDGKERIVGVENETRGFEKFSDKVIMSLAIVKFCKENSDQIDRIEKVISPQYYELPNARIKLKSYNTTTDTKLEIVDPKIESRFSWIDGKLNFEKGNDWGFYKDEDKGVYAAFGVLKYPKEIWSRIPLVNNFIARLEKTDSEIIYIDDKNSNWERENYAEVFEEIKKLSRGPNEETLSDHIGSYGINELSSSIARSIGQSTDILEKNAKGTLSAKKNKEKEWEELVKKSNFRNYYHPFFFDEKTGIWEEDVDAKGLLVMQKINDPQSIEIAQKSYNFERYGWNIKAKINQNIYKKNKFLIYDAKTKVLTVAKYNAAIYLK